jgi:hypothetical protein
VYGSTSDVLIWPALKGRFSGCGRRLTDIDTHTREYHTSE